MAESHESQESGSESEELISSDESEPRLIEPVNVKLEVGLDNEEEIEEIEGDDGVQIRPDMLQVVISEVNPNEPVAQSSQYDPNAFRNYNDLPWYEKGILQYFNFPVEEMLQKQQDRMKKIIGQCKYCVGVKQISGSLNVTSNFIKHVRALHPQMYALFEEERATRFKKPAKKRSLPQASHVRKQENPSRLLNEVPPPRLQSFNDFHSPSKIAAFEEDYESPEDFKEVTTQEQYSEHLLKFIVHGLQPISLVEHPAFINFTHGLRPDLEVEDQASLKRNLVKAKKNMLSRLVSKLEKTQYVCTTLDLWKAQGKSFLGMTAHWLNEETMQRDRALFCCERYSGSHSPERVVELIRETHAVYGVEGKVLKIFTDNLSDQFKIKSILKNEGDQPQEEEEEKLINYQNAEGLLSSCQDQYILPENQRTPAQILKQIACKDAASAANWSPSYKLLYKESMTKCKAIWDYARTNDNGAETLKGILGYNIEKIKNNSFNFDFEFIRSLVHREAQLGAICQKFGIAPLLQRHIAFMKEYISVLHPLFQGIDVLFKEKNATMGYLLPTLAVINKKISALKVKTCATLQYTLVESLNKNFAEYFESKECLLASITTPKFKVWWNDIGLQQEDMIELLRNSVAENLDNVTINSDEDDDFFHNKSHWGGNLDPCFSYLNDQRTNLEMLNDYPQIKALYLHYNCALSTCVPVTRIFTNSILEQMVRSEYLSDDLFETLLLLKLNK